MAWSDAQKTCQSEKGNLATIENSSLNKFIEEMVNKEKVEYPWIGAYLISLPDKEWGWIDGSPFNYANWDEDGTQWAVQPEYNENEKCVEFVNGKWHDFVCSFKRSFVCSYNEGKELFLIVLIFLKNTMYS